MSTVATTTAAVATAAPADLGRRTLAALIDLLVVGAMFFAFAATIGEISSEGSSFEASLSGGAMLLFVAATLAYYGVSEALTGRTLGKAVFGLRVVNVADNAPAQPGQVVIRTLLRLIDALPLLYLIGFVCAAASERTARVGDFAARTAVIQPSAVSRT
jgi:uncharacterized RDD family membrane protein YckC